MPKVAADHLERVGKEAALRAGTAIFKSIGALQRSLKVENKSAVDLVTDVDLAAEKAIIEVIHSHFPSHSIFAEESGARGEQTEYQWVIDPLDGTTNFCHSTPHCAVSVACLHNGVPEIGIVLDPCRNELFCAQKDKPTLLNDREVTVTTRDALNQSLLATGFAYDRQSRADCYIPVFQDLMIHSQGIRRMGAAALDLAWVACGRFDGFFEEGLNPWDVAAGILLVERAGGKVSNYGGDFLDINHPDHLVASNGRIHEPMLEIIKPHRKEELNL